MAQVASPPEDTHPAKSSKGSQPVPSLCLNKIQYFGAIKERPTGAYYFIALQLLNPSLPTLTHLACHDLESFYWVLVWIVLRHTNHDHPMGSKRCDNVFPHGDDVYATDAKTAWINGHPALKIRENEPLSELLELLAKLAHEATRVPRKKPQIPLTYNTVCQAFNEVLARDDWPVNDKAIPFPCEKTRINAVFGEESIHTSTSLSGILKRTFGQYVTGSQNCDDPTFNHAARPASLLPMESTKPEKRRKRSATNGMVNRKTAAA
ncbi:hypothetical protein C8Q79DRAFT_1007212 [Trametes meyenii]|nr:hypothetical protein C8Q79DRAFT_1007212 [Trametes meyenii]